jgi:hypothetical protein
MRHGKRDGNQTREVAALRDRGVSVADTASVGDGFVDIIVGVPAGNLLVELKDGTKPPSARKLTPAEVEFHRTWRGPKMVALSAAEVVAELEQRGWLPTL